MSDRWPVLVDPIWGCEIWQGKVDRDGYGVWWRNGKAHHAHRFAYERDVGPIPEGMVADHLCRNRLCSRASHLELVTQSENEKRKSWKYRARRQRCPRGHDLAFNAMVTPHGGRLCRLCNREPQEGVRT